MLNKCKINSLAVTNQVSHFGKTTVVLGQVPGFHLLTTNYNQTIQYRGKEN